jgi:hypothetical protein
MRTLAAMATVTVLAACATPGQVGDQVVKANIGQEQAHNRLLLLNVVRAYHRLPMHFSKVTAVRLPLGIGNPTFTAPTPWGPDFVTQVYQFSTQVSISQGVDSTPLDSQEFYRGITTPVSPTLLAYYLDQGWPQQMILHMFVRSVEIYEKQAGQPDKLVRRIENYPQKAAEFDKFQRAMQGLAGCELDTKITPSRTPYGPTYKDTQVGNGQGLAAAKTADLVLLPVDGKGEVSAPDNAVGYRFFKEQRVVELKFSKALDERADCIPPGEAQALAFAGPDARKGTVGGQKTAVLVLRSPEAMLYYLGELGRAQLSGQYDRSGRPDDRFPLIRYRSLRGESSTDGYTLFRLLKGRDANAAVTVEFEGETFSVPRSSSSDRSMHVLSLLTQIVALQNKAGESPFTSNVRLVQ